MRETGGVGAVAGVGGSPSESEASSSWLNRLRLRLRGSDTLLSSSYSSWSLPGDVFVDEAGDEKVWRRPGAIGSARVGERFEQLEFSIAEWRTSELLEISMLQVQDRTKF